MDTRWNKKYDPQIIEQELANTHPYTDGKVEVLRVSPNGVVPEEVTLTRVEWKACLNSKAIARLLIDYR